MKSRQYIYNLALCALAILYGGCARNAVGDLEQTFTDVHICFQWDLMEAKDSIPQIMTVYFYPTDKRNLRWRFNVDSQAGGVVSLPCGRYNAIAVNPDAENLIYDTDAGFNGFEISMSRPASLPSGVTSANPTMAAPGNSLCGISTDITVTPCGISYIAGNGKEEGCLKECPFSKMRIYPYSPLANYQIIVRNLKESDKIQSLSCSLSSLSPGYRPALESFLENPINIPIKLHPEIGNNSYSAKFLTFGHINGVTAWLNLYAVLTDGSKKMLQYDVTSQILNSSNPRNVIIYIDNPSISDGSSNPDTGETGSGFDVDVSDWTIITIDYTFP